MRLFPCLVALGMAVLAGFPADGSVTLRFPAFEAQEEGMLFRGAHPRVLGLDGAYSLPLGRGRSLWIFGDTLLGSWLPDGRRQIEGFPPNTAAIADDAEWKQGFASARMIGLDEGMIPASGSHRTWPLDLVSSDGRPWLYTVTIEAMGKGPLDFRVVGHGIARGAADGSSFDRPLPLWPGSAPSFGTSALRWKGHLYLFSGGAETYLARTQGKPEDLSSYRYWAADKGWVEDWRYAAPLPGSGPEMSVRYNPYLDAFLMVYIGPFSTTIEARLAPTPWGPWSEPTEIHRCRPPGAMFYGAKQHGQFDEQGGRKVLITYNTNGTEAQLTSRPDIYWPRLLRVRFTRPVAR